MAASAPPLTPSFSAHPPPTPAPAGRPRLTTPSAADLAGYLDALHRGWSPDNGRDVAAEQLALATRGGAAALLAHLTDQRGLHRLPDGRTVARTPFRALWLHDATGAFAGAVTLRYLPGTHALPEHIPGHIGYAVVPWKRGQGLATRALALALDEARGLGLRHVDLACVHDNEASKRVILANGGTLRSLRPHPWLAGKTRLLFRIAL